MMLTRDFKVTIQERVLTDPEFRVGLLTQAAECLLNNEINVAKALLRDYVNATLGFKQLGALMGKKPQSLMRMLSDNGNPRLSNISELVSSLRKNEGIELHVRPEKIMSDSAQRERPKVYFTNSGTMYVKADELLKSKRGRAAVNKMAQFNFKRRKSDTSGKLS